MIPSLIAVIVIVWSVLFKIFEIAGGGGGGDGPALVNVIK